MREARASFTDLIDEAERHPTVGWDFSWLDGRIEMSRLPWHYTDIVLRYAYESPDLLDLGTGGGEWLAALPYRPSRTVATEAWSPNVPVARRRLGRLGIQVVQVGGAPDNNVQSLHPELPRLPFGNASFHLVTDRHESFVASEVALVLRAGGHFVTKQLGDGLYHDFRALFGVAVAEVPAWSLAMAVDQVEHAGLVLEESGESRQAITFADVGALVWYLRMVPWIVPRFSVLEYRHQLAELDARIQEHGPLTLYLPSFYMVARQPT
jgi:SAM-dependent methyltransferase